MRLSDEIFVHDDGYHPKEDVLLVSDVKRFIKQIKQKADGNINYSTCTGNQILKEEIDKLAGDALVATGEGGSK